MERQVHSGIPQSRVEHEDAFIKLWQTKDGIFKKM